MSSRTLRRHGNSLEYIEKLINRSSLTTKKATHSNIITIGGQVWADVNQQQDESYDNALKSALYESEARSSRELKAALQLLREQLDKEKSQALQNQKEHYEKLAKRVSEQRDRLETERLKELKALCDLEKANALRQQWEEAERQKKDAIREACEELTQKLRQEFAIAKENAIAAALQVAREGFKKRLAEAIAATERECQRKAEEEAARVAQIHRDEVQRLELRYQLLKTKYEQEHSHRVRVESDFAELQTDYKRFMDYTDGTYHSDFMMQLRHQGLQYADKQPSLVSVYSEKGQGPYPDLTQDGKGKRALGH